MNHIFTTHSPVGTGSFETQRTLRKADMIVTRIPRLPNSGHTPCTLRCRRRVFMPAGPGISLNRHLPIGRNISGSLCDLCASSVAGGETSIFSELSSDLPTQ